MVKLALHFGRRAENRPTRRSARQVAKAGTCQLNENERVSADIAGVIQLVAIVDATASPVFIGRAEMR